MKKDKTLKIIEIVLLVCIIILLVDFLTGKIGPIGMSSDIMNHDVNLENIEVAKEAYEELGDIDQIQTDLYDANLEVSFWKESQIKVVESTNDKEKSNLFTIQRSGNTLCIVRKQPNHIMNFGTSPYHKVELFIPETYKDELKLETSSGNINMLTDVEVTALDINTSSGTVMSGARIVVEQLEQVATSGNIHYNEVEATKSYLFSGSSGNMEIQSLIGSGKLMTTAGNITIGKVAGNAHEINSSSGKIKIDEGQGDFSLSTKSGGAAIGKLVGEVHSVESYSGKIEITELEGDCTIDSSSGSIDIQNLKGKQHKIASTAGDISVDVFTGLGTVNASSGKVKMNIEELTGDLEIETTSGSVKIQNDGAVAAEIAISTHSGNIRGNSEIAYIDQDKEEALSTWEGDDKKKIQIKTSSGSIEINE